MTIDPATGRSAAGIIRLLDLQPHSEGGFFRETFRDSAQDSAGRAVSTLIYFLLEEGQLSRWHRVDATEVWHFYAGAPLELKTHKTAGNKRAPAGPESLCGGAPAICCSGALLAERDEPWILDARWLLRRAGLRILRLRTRAAGLAVRSGRGKPRRNLTSAAPSLACHSLEAIDSICFCS